MEPNERHHHHHQDHLTSPYYHPFHHHIPTTVSAAPAISSAGNSIPSSSNGNFPPPPHNDGSSSSSLPVYPHSVPSSAVTVPIDPVKRKRGRPRKYETPAQALAAKKLASSASNSSARERREQAAAAAGVSPSSKSGSRKSLLGKTGQSFTPHILNIAPGEDVAQKIFCFSQQSVHELCILSASGAISNVCLSHMASGTSVSYEGQYEILSLSGSYIRGEHGVKTGGLSVSLSSSEGEIFGGGVKGLLKAAGPVQVILGTFQLDRKKDGRNGAKGDAASGSGSMLPSPSGTESLIGFHSSMESPGRNPNEEHHHTITSSALGGGAHFMMQPPQGIHMRQARPSEWVGAGYDLSGLRGNGSSENGDYE